MSTQIVLLLLLAALLHAAWNALLRSGVDRLWSMTVMCLAIAIASAPAAVFLNPPAKASWIYAALSAALHVGYNLFLIRSYQAGELVQTYPIARGSSPIVIALAASFFASESIGPSALLGIALVSGGIISLSFNGKKLGTTGVAHSLGTGCFIGAYSVTDGIGVRLSGAPMAYTMWMCALWGILMLLMYISMRDAKSLFTVRPGFTPVFIGGLVSLLAYGIVIYAMSVAPMGAVSALRETSVLFVVLIGYFFLGETLTVPKVLACVVIVLGIIIIG